MVFLLIVNILLPLICKRDVSIVIDILKQIAQRFMPPAVAGDEQRFTVAVQRRG